jgi:carbamoyltransferase
VADPVEAAAAALAAGEIIGWVQGRAEFGPRALGHRSILADPRPVANRDRVNHRIKRREAFRPFAPAVRVDDAGDWFEPLAAQADTDHMNFVHLVRPDRREQLGAVTHVDGTARVQTVDPAVEPRFAALLTAFGERTGVPVLLNTSFNGSAEPIVDDLDDAVAGLLTLGLDRLVVGDHVVTPAAGVAAPGSLVGLCPSLPFHRRLDGEVLTTTVIDTFDQHPEPVSPAVAALLARADGGTPLTNGDPVEEVAELWRRKVVHLRPPPP